MKLTALVNNVKQFSHSLLAPPVPNRTGRCRNHFLINPSRRLTLQARKTVPMAAIRPIGTTLDGGVFNKYSSVMTYILMIGVEMNGGRKVRESCNDFNEL